MNIHVQYYLNNIYLDVPTRASKDSFLFECGFEVKHIVLWSESTSFKYDLEDHIKSYLSALHSVRTDNVIIIEYNTLF